MVVSAREHGICTGLSLSLPLCSAVSSAKLLQQVEEVVGAVVPGLTRLIEDLLPTGGFHMTYTAKNETFVTFRAHRSGLVSVLIENYGKDFLMENRVSPLHCTVLHT